MRWLGPSTRSKLATLLLLLALWAVVPPIPTSASAPLGLPAGASCAALAGVDPTETNGPEWGRTLLSGHNAPGGWFGVDVCGNGINRAEPGGANVSCDRPPANVASAGCAPGAATYDGFGLSFQCVELVVRFAAWAFGDAPSAWHGDAPDLWLAGHHPADLIAIANGAKTAPVPGDMLVWGQVDNNGNPWPAGPQGDHNGHVAVVAAVRDGTIIYVEENTLLGQTNIPTETLPLSQRASGWTAGDPGGPRRLYGWLHSVKNRGKLTGSAAIRGAPTPGRAPSATATTTVPTTPTANTSANSTVILPSLAQGVVVTAAGALAGLTWTGGSLSTPTVGPLQIPAPAPHIAAQSLGVPNGGALVVDQSPVVMVSPDGSRDIYVLGTDGAVCLAQQAPQPAAQDAPLSWRSLGAPPSTRFSGGVATAQIPGALVMGAVSTDGTLWWRAGPADNLSGWTSVGRPTASPLTGPPIFVGEPGTGLPLAIALGRDGKLYERLWTSAGASPASAEWSDWMAVPLPQGVASLTSPTFLVRELPAPNSHIGAWDDVPIDLAVRDVAGNAWLLRRTADEHWTGRALGASRPIDGLFGAAIVPASATGDGTNQSLLSVYVADAASIELGQLNLGSGAAAPNISWTPLGSLPHDITTTTPSAVVNLGPRLTLLAAGAGDQMVIGGTAEAQQLVGLRGLDTPAPTDAPSATVIAVGAAP